MSLRLARRPGSANWYIRGAVAGRRVYETAGTADRSRAGIAPARVHDLRHTFASWLAQAGASLAQIGALLGHADPRSTMIYAHLQTDHLRATIASLPAGTPAEAPAKKSAR